MQILSICLFSVVVFSNFYPIMVSMIGLKINCQNVQGIMVSGISQLPENYVSLLPSIFCLGFTQRISLCCHLNLWSHVFNSFCSCILIAYRNQRKRYEGRKMYDSKYFNLDLVNLVQLLLDLKIIF